jgi:hypothetical protein
VNPSGFAQSLSDACVTLQTTYNNFYVETYEQRIILYLKHCLMNAFPNMSPGSAKSIAEDYCVYQITREKELDPASIPAEHREAVITFTSTNPDMINLQRLVPAIPLTKVEASKHPGKLIALFRYILRSFEHMGAKYRREHLRKATFICRKTLKSATALHINLKVIVPSFERL